MILEEDKQIDDFITNFLDEEGQIDDYEILEKQHKILQNKNIQLQNRIQVLEDANRTFRQNHSTENKIQEDQVLLKKLQMENEILKKDINRKNADLMFWVDEANKQRELTTKFATQYKKFKEAFITL